ncbi:MAG: Maf family protein [Acidobacteriota bacterium]
METASPEPAADKRLILASGSPRRRELLAGLGLHPEVRPVDIDESPRPGEDASTYVARLAEEKARERAEPGELILAADTVVALDGELLGKPTDPDEARSMLRRLSGRAHDVLTGVALYDPAADRVEVEVVSTAVHFNPLGDREIDWYVNGGEPMDKAGAYGIQGQAAVFIERLEGNYSNVVGLPLPTVYRLLGGASMLAR